MSNGDAPIEGELILYLTQEGTVRVEVLYESETFWLNQKRIAVLFGVDVRTVSYHLAEIYKSGELQEERTLRKSWRVQTEGSRQVRREIEFYNLDAIIPSVTGSTVRRPPSPASGRPRPCAVSLCREAGYGAMKIADWATRPSPRADPGESS